MTAKGQTLDQRCHFTQTLSFYHTGDYGSSSSHRQVPTRFSSVDRTYTPSSTSSNRPQRSASALAPRGLASKSGYTSDYASNSLSYNTRYASNSVSLLKHKFEFFPSQFCGILLSNTYRWTRYGERLSAFGYYACTYNSIQNVMTFLLSNYPPTSLSIQLYPIRLSSSYPILLYWIWNY